MGKKWLNLHLKSQSRKHPKNMKRNQKRKQRRRRNPKRKKRRARVKKRRKHMTYLTTEGFIYLFTIKSSLLHIYCILIFYFILHNFCTVIIFQKSNKCVDDVIT